MRLRTSLISLAVLTLASLLLCLAVREAFQSPPWIPGQSLSYPTSARVDDQGNLHILDRSGRRLSRVDRDGTLLWQIAGGQRGKGFYTADLKAVEGDGSAWLLNTIRSQTSGVDEATELLRVDPSGTLAPPIWRLDTSTIEQGAYNQLPYFHRIIGRSLLYLIADTQGNTLLHEVSLDTGSDRVVRTFPDLDAYQYVSADYDPGRSRGWFLDTYGRILQWSFTGDGLTEIFGNDGTRGATITVPSDLTHLNTGGFLVLDGKGTILQIDEHGTASPWFGADQAGADLYLASYSYRPDGRLVLCNEASHSVLLWNSAQAEAPRVLHRLGLTAASAVLHWIAWAVAAIGILGFIALIVLVYVRVMRKRTPLLVKQLGVSLPLVMAAVLVSSLWVYQDLMQRYTSGVEDRQIVWSQLGASMVDPTDIDALGMGTRSQGDIMDSEPFGRLAAQLSRIVNDNADPWNATTYDYLYVPAGKDWYVFDQYTYFERYLPRPAMLEVAATGRPAIITYSDAYSSWLSAFSPVFREDGTVAALFEITVDQNLFTEVSTNFQTSLALIVGLILLVLVAVTALSTWFLLLSIRSLKDSATLIGEGNYDVQVNIRSRDEIEDLGEVFNKMSLEIRTYVDRVIKLNQANAKFVPAQFLTYLGKDSITDIRLGDQVQRELTVLFSDIRAFTSLSEQMSPEENFNFINRYLTQMGPVIRQHGGFIDKYIGDAIMALFPDTVEDSLRAALGMFEGLARLNLHGQAMHIGIGLHTGMAMLGIIGEAERFDGTVISDTVNIASRLESLTKYYTVGILVSGQVLAQLGPQPWYESRLLDRVQVKGRSEALEIHEVLVPSLPGYTAKSAERPTFAAALASYFAGDFTEATAAFTALRARNPDDPTIEVYLRRMVVQADRPAAGTWTGTTVLDSK